MVNHKKEVRIVAIYHFSAQVISRGKGQSAVAAAAYRSGDKLQDERTGEEKFYRREVSPDSMILTPSNTPEWMKDRERLWNAVEKAEKRKDSQLAREINIALPVELSSGQQKELIRDFVQEQFVDKGMIADVCIHRDDSNNPHAHVMLTTREITTEGFGPKNRSWNDKGLLEQWRVEWANHTNKALEREGVQERISHLSHADRGLEQLPTVHLGHVVNEMEKRGVQTEKGNINRDRQEYNALVVDLQKYREEKQAIEEKIAQQRHAEKKEQEQQPKKVEQQQQNFNTPEERAAIQNASEFLKADPTFSNIAKRREQLDKWRERLTRNDDFVSWKDKSIREATQIYKSIAYDQKNIQEQRDKLDNTSWHKFKEKEKIQETISDHFDQIDKKDGQLNYYREKLGFETENEFNQVKAEYETERPKLIEKIQSLRKRTNYERDSLKNAEGALKNGFIRKVASNYPERPELQEMSFETAQKLDRVNQLNGKTVPIQTIKNYVTNKKQDIDKFEREISSIGKYSDRLKHAEDYLKEYESSVAIIEKHDSSLRSSLRLPMSKSTKKEYENAVTVRDRSLKYMEKIGEITDRADFEKQSKALGEMKVRIPEFKDQIKVARSGLSLLDAILQGVQQAGHTAYRKEQTRQMEKSKGKGSRKRQNQWEWDR